MQQDYSRIYMPGEFLCREGEPGRELFFITEGRVKVCRLVDGKEMDLAELGSGSIVGEMAVIDQSPRSASVVAMERTRVIPMTSGKLDAVFRNAPDIAVSIVKLLCLKLREANDRMRSGFSTNDWVFWRRTVYILTLLAAVGDSRAESIYMPDQETRTNLAVALGLSIAEVSQVVDRLLSSGLVSAAADTNHVPYLCFQMSEMNMFYNFLDRYFGSNQQVSELDIASDTYNVCIRLLDLCRKHFGRVELASSTFKRSTLIEFISSDREVFSKHSADMRKKLINEQLGVLAQLGYLHGEISMDGAVSIDLAGLAQRIQEEEFIRLSLQRYHVLSA